jgi:hypothetical protein
MLTEETGKKEIEDTYLHTQRGALEYVCGKKWGSIEDLKKEIGDEMFKRFKLVGYIECGVKPLPLRNEGEKYQGTWKTTKTADADVCLYKNPKTSRYKQLLDSIF